LPGESADTINIGVWLFNNGNVRRLLTFHHSSQYSYSIYRWTSPRCVPNHASLCSCSVRW